MNKSITLLFLVLATFFCTALGQNSAKIIRDSTQPCLLTKANLPVTSGLKLGSNLSELKREFPELSQAENSPFPNTTAYFTDSPFSNISHILLVFSSENKLMLYTLYYTPQEWTSIEEPFNQATTLVKLTISKKSWTIWKENEKETITVICKDFGLSSKLNPLKAGQNNNKLKNFSLTVADKLVGR